MSGIIDTVGSKSGIVGSDVYPAGHVVQTTKLSVDVAPSHISTTSGSAEASGLIISTPATTGSNYNIITLSANSYTYANQNGYVWLYVSKNGGAYALATGGSNSCNMHFSISSHRRFNATWIDDSSGLTAGTNLYQIYFARSASSFYLVHQSHDYHMTVQEIKV